MTRTKEEGLAYLASPEYQAKIEAGLAEARAKRACRLQGARANNRADRGEAFSRVPQSMIPALAMFGSPVDVALVLILNQRVHMRRPRQNGGWVTLPGSILREIGLADRSNRGRTVRRLVARGVLETRSIGKGAALEYRLTPWTGWSRPDGAEHPDVDLSLIDIEPAPGELLQ